MKYIFILLPIGAFAAVGGLVGWYVGASESPVVGTILPLIFGVVGVLGYGFLERRFRDTKWLQKIQSLPYDDAAKKKIAETLTIDETSAWMPAYFALCVITFCVTCYFGTRHGILERHPPNYPSLNQILLQAKIAPNQVTALDGALLENLRLQLQALKIAETETITIFRDVISPAMTDDRLGGHYKTQYPNNEDAWLRRHQALHDIVWHLLVNLKEANSVLVNRVCVPPTPQETSTSPAVGN